MKQQPLLRGYVLTMSEDGGKTWSIESSIYPKGKNGEGLRKAQKACYEFSRKTKYLWDIGVVTSIVSKMVDNHDVRGPEIVKESTRTTGATNA